jgi:hypothetical protein
MPDKNKKNKASKFRMMRPVQGQYFPGQVEGSVSTHISSVFESDGKYFVAPTITNKKAPYAGYQPQSFGEAYKAGEAIPFDSFDEAMFFSQNYKLPKYPKPEFKNGGSSTSYNQIISDVDDWYKSYLQGPNYERMLSNYNLTYPRDNMETLANRSYNPMSSTKELGLSFKPSQVRISDDKKDDRSLMLRKPFDFADPNWDFKKSFLGIGEYGLEDRSIIVSTNQAKKINIPVNEIVAHEYGHIDHNLYGTGDKEIDKRLRSSFQPIGRSKSNQEHNKKIGEIRSDAIALRYLMQKEGVYDSVKGGEFTEDTLNKFLKIQEDKPRPTDFKDLPWSGRLLKNFRKKDIVWIINNLASTDSVKKDSVQAEYGGNMKKFKYNNGGKGSKTYLDSQRKRVTGSPIIPGMNFESDATMFGSPLLDPSYMQMMLDDQPGDQAPFDYRSIMNEDLYLDNVRKKPTTDFDAFLKAYRESGIDDRAYGGKAEVDYEAEDGEVVIGNISVNKAYNGGTAERYKGADMYMLKGARHSDGGIGIKMHGGDASYVFSDRLDAGGMSYAKAASKFGKELDEVNQMAMGGDAYDVNTAKRMSPRLMAEVKDLYDDQEAYKKEQGIDQDPDKMFLGGLIKKGVGALTKLGAGAGLGPLGVAATMLPGVLNIGKGLFGRKPEVDLGTVEPMFQDYQDFSPMEQRFLNQQDRSLAQLQAGLGASGASGQQLRAGVQAGQAGAQAGASQFYNQLGAMEMQNQSQVDGYNIQQQQQADMQNMQLRAQEAQMEANLDPRQSLGKGLSQIMGTVTSLGQQNQKMDMLNKVFGAYGGQFGLRKKY